jgi:hypothetical protein
MESARATSSAALFSTFVAYIICLLPNSLLQKMSESILLRRAMPDGRVSRPHSFKSNLTHGDQT